MEKRLIDQIKFIVEVDKAKEIMRRTYVTNSERFENDAEHSWHLALMAPLLKEYIKEDVNIERVINMVIIHDLVEIDAGDTFCYDKEGNLTKREREVFEYLIQNNTTKEISEKLNISEKTVRNHISNVMQKLGVKGRSAAVVELLKLNEISL